MARLSTETAAFVSFRLLCCQRACFWMHSDVHFFFSSLSSASLPFIVTRHGLSFANFCFSHQSLAIQSFTSPSCRRCQLLGRFVVPSSASHSFTLACRRHHQSATHLLQLLMDVGKEGALRGKISLMWSEGKKQISFDLKKKPFNFFWLEPCFS